MFLGDQYKTFKILVPVDFACRLFVGSINRSFIFSGKLCLFNQK